MKNRERLVELYNRGIKEIEVTGRIKEFSTTVSGKDRTAPTALLVNIRNAHTDELLCDHSWIVVKHNTGEVFAIGKTIRFIANIQKYDKVKYGVGYLRNVNNEPKKVTSNRSVLEQYQAQSSK